MPAPGSACPMLAFTPPSGSAGADDERPDSTTAVNEPISIGSPSEVPVPCASASASASGDIEASANAPRSIPCCAFPLGAVRLAERPSCRTALP
eukprot:7386147-Prymnesium_polylepis.2